MIIKFQNLKSNYTMLPNALIRDKRLSLKARMLAIMVASYSENWEVNYQYFADQLGVSPRSIMRFFTELTNAGWIEKMQHVDEKTGRFTGLHSIIFINQGVNGVAQETPVDLNIKEMSPGDICVETTPASLGNGEEEGGANMGKIAEAITREAPNANDFHRLPKNRLAVQCHTYKINQLEKNKKIISGRKLGKEILLVFKKGKIEDNLLDFSHLTSEEAESFNKWVKYKRANRRAMNIYTQKQVLEKLKKWKMEGYDIRQIISKSIENNWAGLYAPNASYGNGAIKGELKDGVPKPKSNKRAEMRLLILERVMQTMPDFDGGEEATRKLNELKLRMGSKIIAYKRDEDKFVLISPKIPLETIGAN